jgi:ACS family glucarate transporter-like MFS transporter
MCGAIISPMTEPTNSDKSLPSTTTRRSGIRLAGLRPFFTGLLPLFLIAHFGHHVVGAMLNPFMPMIRDELALNYTQAGVIISAFSITGGISQLPAGWLADRFGARLMIAISVSGVALAGLLVGLSHSYLALIAFLVFAALLGGGYHPAAANAISTIMSPERRGRALGLHLIGGSSAFWVVPLIAAPIAAAWGWHAPFLILTIPVIVLGVVLYYLLGRQQRISQQTLITTVESVSVAPTKIEWRILGPFLVMSITTGTLTGSIAAYYSLYLVDHFGMLAPAAAALMAITPAVGVLAAPLGGYFSDRFGGTSVMIIASLLAGPLLFVIKFVPNVALFVIVLLLIGGMNMTRMPTSESFLVSNVPERRRSTILGIYFFAGAETAGVLTPFVGKIIDTSGFDLVFTIASISLLTIAVVCSILLWRARRSIRASGAM